MSNTNINSIGARLVGVDDPTRDDHAATKGYVDAHGGGGSVSVTDGTHTVSATTELDFTSGATVTDAGGGVAQVAVAGGGSQPITREEWNVTGATLNPGDFAWLAWTSSNGPDALLDNTTPAHPTIITAGVYAVSIVARFTGGDTSGSSFLLSLFLDRQGFDASQVARVYPHFAGDGVIDDIPMTFLWYVPAGGTVEIGGEHTGGTVNPGTVTIPFAHIQRVA